MKKQLYQKYKDTNDYHEIDPIVYIDAVSDREDLEKLQDILSRYNSIRVVYNTDDSTTRLLIAAKYRRRGLNLHYIKPNREIVSEFYTLNDISDEKWGDSSNWKTAMLSETIFADEEDITLSEGYDKKILKFKDRDTTDGTLGYVILRRTEAVEDQINLPDTIYEVRYDFDLAGKELIIPANCTLKFNGGILFNGSLVGNNTAIDAPLTNVFGSDLLISGKYNIDCWYPEWFGAKGNSSSFISTTGIQKALDAARDTTVKTVKLVANNYYIDDTIYLYTKCSLKGACDSIHNFMGNRIYQTVNKDAIHITSTEDDYNIWQVSVENITIYNQYKGDDLSSRGIYIFKDTVGTSFTQSSFHNVWIGYFHTGFMFDGYGHYGFGYNKFNTLQCQYNRIGIHIKGSLSTNTSLSQRTTWANFNQFDFCVINNNSIGAIWFDGLDSEQENVFAQCAIEGNGNGYKAEYYTEVAAAGFAFYAKNEMRYGFTRFINCYIERNYPRREDDSTATDDEYVYGSYIYPNNIESQPVFKCMSQGISVEQCFLGRFVYLYSGSTFAMRFEGNQYDTGVLNYSDNPTIDYIYYFNDSPGNCSYSKIYINELIPRSDISTNAFFTRFTRVFKLAERNDVLEFKNLNTFISHTLLSTNLSIKNGRVNEGTIYVDSSKGSDVSLGLSRCNPCSRLDVAENNINYYNRNKSILIVLLSDYNDSNINPTSYIPRQPITFAGNSSSIVFNSLKQKDYYSDVTIRNMTINLNGLDTYTAFYFQTASNIVIKDCIINYTNTNRFFLRLAKGAKATFINCTFNFLDTSGPSYLNNIAYIQNPSYPNADITMINCTVQEGVTLRYSTNYHIDGSREDLKRAGDFVLIEGKQLALANGDKLINIDGTNRTRCRIPLDSSSFNKASISYIINEDIDLNGETLTLENMSTLDFTHRGKITNGTIVLVNTEILPYGIDISRFITATIDSTSTYREGQILYDSSLKKQKLWNGTTWVNLDGTAIA